MFGKFGSHFNHAKQWVGTAYHQTRKFVGDVDRGMKVAKRVYAVMEPVISQIAGNGVHSNVMKAISGYDNLKHKLTEGHNMAEVYHHKVKRALKV